MSKVAVRRAIYGKMAGDSTLNNLLGSPASGRSKAIYYAMAPAGARFPYVLFNKQAGTPTYGQGDGAKYDSEVWLIKGVDQPNDGDADPVDAIASRLDALLTDGALTISGASQMYLRRQSDIDYSEGESGDEYKHSGALYRLLHEATA